MAEPDSNVITVRATPLRSTIVEEEELLENAVAIPLGAPLDLRKKQQDERPGRWVCAVIHKPTPQCPVGLDLEEIGGDVCIAAIDAQGLFAESPFGVGDRIVSVNKITYPGMDAAFVTQVMQDTREQLIVVAENEHACHDLTTVMVAKSRPSLGIRAKLVHGEVRISRIDQDSLFADSLLAVGDVCRSINGVSCAGLDRNDVALELRKPTTHATFVAAKRKTETAVDVCWLPDEDEKADGFSHSEACRHVATM